MKIEVLTPEHEKAMAEHPGLNQRQWWLVSDLTERLSDALAREAALQERIKKLKSALSDAKDRLEWFRDLKGMDSAAQIEWAGSALREDEP